MLYSIRLKQEGLFANKDIFNLLIPILIEQAIIVAIGIVDTIMVAYVGETAVAGISLIITVDTLVKVQMSALAVGGSIVISQYIGKKELVNGNNAMKMAYYSILFIALAFSALLFVFRKPFLALIAGNVEAAVMKSAQTYFSLSLFSYPFFAVYYVVSASFRAVGNSRVSMIYSLAMMMMNLVLKAILIYKFNMGVAGAGISTLFSVVFIGISMTVMACKPLNLVHIENISKIKLDFAMIKRILGIGIPNSIENGMFQLGILLLQRLTASFGTAAIAANAICKSLSPISYIFSQCYGLVIVTVIGQCMGAGKIGQADMYTKHILKLNYLIALVINLFCIATNGLLISSFNLSQETSKLASDIFIMYCIGAIFFYPTSFVLPNALRASGDTKFTMIASVSTMFGTRIGLAYVFGKHMNMGLFGVWLAMQVDWFVRSIIFVFRFQQGNWKKIKVV